MEQKVTVSVAPERLCVRGDFARLVQVMGNLLNNASKFTGRGGRIALTLAREGSDAVIRVRDTGIGIAADQLTRIFDMFTQIDISLARHSGAGLGIGLALVKKLVELHGGTVAAESAGVGQGSEFVVRLPLVMQASKSPAEGETSMSGTAPISPRRILVVDDNRDAAESLAMLLQANGHEVHIAYDGRQAVETAEAIRPNLVLLDIGLPQVNGYDVARRIRELAWGREVMLVALTGWGQAEDRQRSKDAGFDAHLVKPVDPDTLTKLVVEANPG